MASLIECVPNFSEGRNPQIIKHLIESINRVATATVLDTHSDPDHHRTVITYVVTPEHAVEAALSAARVARDAINLNWHRGAHPRLGAMDVLPFVPLEECDLPTCIELASAAGEAIARELQVPIYFYAEAARQAARRKLEDVRRGGFERRREQVTLDASMHPDICVDAACRLHETAGAYIIGARRFLIAFNINLATDDVNIARRIAAAIRASNGGLPAVKALGLYLPHQACAQVSINLTDFTQTSLGEVFNTVERAAANLNTSIKESELVGLMPRAAFDEHAAYVNTIRGFHQGMILEEKIESLEQLKIE